MGSGRDFLSFQLSLDHGAQAGAVFVAKLPRIEGCGEALDQLQSQFLFLFLWFGCGLVAIFRDGANLIGVKDGVQSERGRGRPNGHEVFALMHVKLGDGGVLGFLHCFEKQLVSLFAGIFGSSVIRSVEVERIDLIGLNELQYFHGTRGGRIELVQFLFGEENILIFLVFESLYDFVALDLPIASGAELRLANARVTHLVELVEADALCSRRRKEPDGNRYEAKSEMALPHRSCHENTSCCQSAVGTGRQRDCKVKESQRRMQGEELAKVREMSLVPAMSRRREGNDPSNGCRFAIIFCARIPENESEQTGEFRLGRKRRAGPATFGLRALRRHGIRAISGNDT